jgi:hypothetical protein
MIRHKQIRVSEFLSLNGNGLFQVDKEGALLGGHHNFALVRQTPDSPIEHGPFALTTFSVERELAVGVERVPDSACHLTDVFVYRYSHPYYAISMSKARYPEGNARR